MVLTTIRLHHRFICLKFVYEQQPMRQVLFEKSTILLEIYSVLMYNANEKVGYRLFLGVLNKYVSGSPENNHHSSYFFALFLKKRLKKSQNVIYNQKKQMRQI